MTEPKFDGEKINKIAFEGINESSIISALNTELDGIEAWFQYLEAIIRAGRQQLKFVKEAEAADFLRNPRELLEELWLLNESRNKIVNEETLIEETAIEVVKKLKVLEKMEQGIRREVL